VPDETWARIVPPEFRSRVVCLYCFDDFACERATDYAAALHTLYFAGDAASFEFCVTSAVEVAARRSCD
jgi:hypothetical protein